MTRGPLRVLPWPAEPAPLVRLRLPTLSALRPGPLLRPQPLAVGLPLPSSLAAGPVRRRRRPGCSYRGTRIATEGAMSFAAIWPPVWYEAGRQLRAACRGDGKEGSGWTA